MIDIWQTAVKSTSGNSMKPRHCRTNIIHYLEAISLIGFALLLCGFFWQAPTWKSISETIADQYPEVRYIDPKTLLLQLQQAKTDGHKPPLIIDVREAEEFAVSHLPGAINLTDPTKVTAEITQPIVVYCSVGIRSAAFAQKLLQRGYQKVFNLPDSMFCWANRDYPLLRDTVPVHVVHPYNQRWGKLLQEEHHSYHP